MTIRQALVWATNELKNKKIKTASLDAEVLLSFAVKKPKEYLYTYPEKRLNTKQQKLFQNFISRRKKYEPVAYIRNIKEFFGLDFYVDKNVLIPRSDTELLVENVINKAKNSPLTIADIGTGSGCIAISLKKNLPKAVIYATDVSTPALKIAKKNAKRLGVKIKFYHGNLLKPVINKKIDVLAANLPYLDNKLKNLIATGKTNKNSLYYEPTLALHGGKSGLEIYKEFFRQAKKMTYKPKIIFCEIGHNYIKSLEKMISDNLPEYSAELKKNLAGFNRILVLKYKKSA